MKQRTVFTRKGLTYKKRTQRRVGGNWVPNYTNAIAATNRRDTAFRHVRHRKRRYREKVFRFKIIRDDGTVIDHTTIGLIQIYGEGGYNVGQTWGIIGRLPEGYGYVAGAFDYDEEDPEPEWSHSGNVWTYEDEWQKFSYNTETEIWTVYFFDEDESAEKIKKNGKFFVFIKVDEYSCITVQMSPDKDEDGINEYIHIEDEKYSIEDTVKVGFYEVKAPYFKVEYETNAPYFEPVEDCTECEDVISQSYDNWRQAPAGNYFTNQSYFYKKITVYSSLPYTVVERVSYGTVETFGYSYDFYITTEEDCPATGTLRCGENEAEAALSGTVTNESYNDGNIDTTEEEFNVMSPSMSGQTYSLELRITQKPVIIYDYCLDSEGIPHEQYVDCEIYRTRMNRSGVGFLTLSAYCIN